MRKNTSTTNAVFLLIPLFALGQVQDVNQDIYMLFDNIVGLDNTGIYNGIEHRETFQILGNNHAYFVLPDFRLGTIEYDGQTYYNINLKYNLYEQEVIAMLKSRNTSEAVIKLYNSKIKSFTINNRKFINIPLNTNGVQGFYEEAFKDSGFSLLIKHKKFKKDLYQNGQMHVEFVTAKNEYLIHSNDLFHEIDSKKDITNLFADFKQKINQFYNDNRSLRKADYYQFLINLLQELTLAGLK